MVRVEVTPSDEVQQLRAQVERLTLEKAELVQEMKRVERLYYNECTVNLRIEDENARLKQRLKELERVGDFRPRKRQF